MATNDRKTWILTVKLPNDQPLFTLLIEQDLLVDGAAPAPAPSASSAASPPAPANPGKAKSASVPRDEEPKMTEPQRRYLFRLLALQGVEGDDAEQHLKDYFQVKALRDIPKAAASQLIDQLITDLKEAGHASA